MADVIARLKVDSSEYDSKINKARNGLLRLEESLRAAGKDFTQADSAQVKFVQDLGKMETVSRTARGQMNELKTAFTDLSVQYKRMSDLERQSPIGKAMAQSLGQLKGRIATLRTDLAGVEKQLGGVGGNAFTRGLGSAFSMFGPAALAAGGVMAAMNGLRTAMSSLIQTNMQFEQASANLAAVLGTTRDQTTALTAQAKQLGATTQYTAIQITDLQTNLARLGFTQQEILASTKAIQYFATATRADLGEAANLAGAALRGFGMNASEMERVASVLAVSTTKSALSFEKLATAIPIVAPVAKQFGFTIEDTVTMLAKLSDAGMDASMSATATRNIFLKMANESGKLAQALGRPVHNVEEFGEALKELREKGMSLNDILSMVGVRSTAAFAVFADNADTLKDFKDSITGCSDALQGMVDEQLNTLQGSVTIMKSAWEGLMLTFSNSNGILKETTDALTRLLQAWTNWNKRRQGGDAAISTYELGLSNEQRKGAKAVVEGYRAGGMKDEEIKLKIETDTQPLVEARDKAKALYDQLEKIQNAGQQQAWNKAFRNMFPEYNVEQHGAAPNYLAQQIAAQNDAIALQNYMASLVTPASVGTPAGSGTNGEGSADKKTTARLKARYEEEEKAQIAALDRMVMKEEEYEAKVYEIKRAALEKIAKLYDEDSAERARANAAISSLDISYQGTQMRLANKKEKSETKSQEAIIKGLPAERDTRVTSQNISTLQKQFQDELSHAFVGSEGYLIAADKIADLNAFQNLLKQAMAAGVEFNPAQMQMLFDNIRLGVDVEDADWQKLVDEINTKLATLNFPPIELDVKTGSVKAASNDVVKMKGDWTQAAQAVAAFGSALQSVEDPTAKVAGIIAEAIASVAAGAGGAIANAAKGDAGGPWGWLAFAISATATMISTIAAIKSATSTGNYASGGIIPGTSFSGDRLTANVNSGELILNRAQQDRIAGQLTAGNGVMGGAQTSQPYVTGEKILLGVNNYLGRSGQGEIVTTGMLRRAGINL